MKIEDLVRLYEEKKKLFGGTTYKHISEILNEAKEIHKREFFIKNPNGDHEQSWRAFKGKNLEKLIVYILTKEVENLGLRIIEGSKLERTINGNLTAHLSRLKRNLLIDYGEFGSHLPDVDIIIYNPKNLNIIAVISSKVTLRERIAQTGYWKIKLSQDEITRHIKVYFITPDEDNTLSVRIPAKKGRAIVEVDTDGCYIMSENVVDESSKVKGFLYFIEDLKRAIDERK